MRRSKKAAGAMSCLLGALLCGFVIMGRPAYAEGYQGQVLMSGQYERSTGANEHKYTKEEAKTFTSAADKLGGGAEHEGGLQHLKTNFLGWTDQPLTADGDIAEGAHFYLAEDTVGDAFPAGLYDGAKLYAVYAGIEVPDTSNPFGVFGWMGSYDSGKLNDMINRSNRLLINKDISDEDMLPYTTLSSEKSDAATGKVVDTYEPSDDVNRINEVVLDAEFTMNPRTSLLVYKDPTFNFGKIGVLTENYGKKFTSGGFSLATGKEAGYTYTDLKMQLPEGLTLPETLYLELDSYTYRPLYVTAGGENLTIINPATQESLGNDKNSFTSLVSSTSPKTIFGVRVAPGTTEIVIRAIVRSNGSTAADSIEKIQAASIAPTDGKSRAEIIASPMRLRVLRRADLKYILPNATPENLNASVIRVSDEKAKELALTEGTQTLPVTGSIEGVARASVGMFNLPFVGNTQLEKYYRINNVAAEMGRSIGYTMPKTYDKHNMTVTETLTGDLLVDDETEHAAVYETEKGAQLSVRGRLDVKKIKNQMAAIEAQYNGAAADSIRIENVDCSFTATLTLPEGMEYPEDVRPQLFGAADSFTITDVQKNGRILTVKMALKEGITNYAQMKAAVDAVENSLYVTVPGITFADASTADTNYTITGSITGHLRADATVDAARQTVHFDFTWKTVQLPEGADAIDSDSQAITLTVRYRAQDGEDNGNTDNGGGTDNGDHDSGREDGGNEANSDRLPGDLLIGEETEHTAVYETEKGAQLSVRGRLDVEKVKKQMAAVEEAYGGNIPPEAILLSEVEGNFTAVLYLPEGMDFEENTTAELSGAGDGFAVTQTIRNGRQLTVNMKLKDGVETYAELKSIVESMENSLYVTVNSIVFTEASRPETNYTINGNFVGMMRAKATVAGSGQSVPFAYSWTAYQLSEGADFLALDSSDIRLTLKYNRSNVDEGNNNNGGSNHNGGTDNGGSDHNGGTNNGGSNNNGGTNNGGSDNNGGRDNNAGGNNGHAAHRGDENAAVNHRGNSPADREPVKNNSVMAAPLTGDRQSATAMFAGLITVSLGVIGVVAIIIFRRKRERK